MELEKNWQEYYSVITMKTTLFEQSTVKETISLVVVIGFDR